MGRLVVHGCLPALDGPGAGGRPVKGRAHALRALAPRRHGRVLGRHETSLLLRRRGLVHVHEFRLPRPGRRLPRWGHVPASDDVVRPVRGQRRRRRRRRAAGADVLPDVRLRVDRGQDHLAAHGGVGAAKSERPRAQVTHRAVHRHCWQLRLHNGFQVHAGRRLGDERHVRGLHRGAPRRRRQPETRVFVLYDLAAGPGRARAFARGVL
mmetsp:Transcript_22379/g.75717  ORF Transcript_22379/g.75717 Transcript_22379/m.75717 type:complete len:209 (-) Transcript_22379:719-1345(-)